MATIREIAKRVGFSQATVSRVLKDDPTFSVKDSTREKILNASLEMGYKNVPQYQRITIPQDVAILDNVVPDEGLQDAYFDELREVLVKHAEEQLMNVTMQKDVDSPTPTNTQASFRLVRRRWIVRRCTVCIRNFPTASSSTSILRRQCSIRCNPIWNRRSWMRLTRLWRPATHESALLAAWATLWASMNIRKTFVRSHFAIGRCVWVWM